MPSECWYRFRGLSTHSDSLDSNGKFEHTTSGTEDHAYRLGWRICRMARVGGTQQPKRCILHNSP